MYATVRAAWVSGSRRFQRTPFLSWRRRSDSAISRTVPPLTLIPIVTRTYPVFVCCGGQETP